MALIYQPSKRIFCGWFEPLKSTTYSEYPLFLGDFYYTTGLGAIPQTLRRNGFEEHIQFRTIQF